MTRPDSEDERILAEELEILVFTYDRAEKLRATLARLLESPFRSCRVTVLDNCSPDHTPEVCREFAGRFASFAVVRHARNIGLGPNYLRAVELARAPYAWILSDDEALELDDCADVVDAIAEGEAVLISLGSPDQQEWERAMRATTQELLRRGQLYFPVWTFAAGVIFRTAAFDSGCLRAGYEYLPGDYVHFPHFPFVYACLRRDVPVYVSRHRLVTRLDRTVRTSETPLSWLINVGRLTARIENRSWRMEAVWQSAQGRRGWVLQLAGAIVLERIERPERLGAQLAELALSLVGPQRLAVLGLAPLAMVPRPLLRPLYALMLRRRRTGV